MYGVDLYLQSFLKAYLWLKRLIEALTKPTHSHSHKQKDRDNKHP